MMRQITIDYTNPVPCELNIAGRIGEHNATELIIVPPEFLSANEKVSHYILAFAVECKVIHSEPISKADELKISLWGQLTQSEILTVQLEGHDSAGELISKTEPVRLRFLNSVCGNETQSDTNNPDFISDYLKNKHSHANKDVLDKFGIDESGNLLFNGEEIKGGGAEGDFVARPELEEYRRNDVNVPSNEVSYENPMLQDESNTVKGALDEAVGYVLTAIPSLQEQINNKQEQGDYVTNAKLDSKLEKISGFSVEVVDTLPTENISTNTMYFVSDGGANALPSATDDEGNIYNGTGYKKNAKWNDVLGDVTADGVDITGYIPVNSGDVIRLKNVAVSKSDVSFPCVLLFADDYYYVSAAYYANNLSALSPVWDNDKLAGFTIPQSSETITHLRIQASNIDETSVVSVNDAYTEYVYVNGAWERVGGVSTIQTESGTVQPNGGSSAVNPKTIAAQTVAVLLEGSTTIQNGLVNVSVESVDVANSLDSHFQEMVGALTFSAGFGGDVLVYTPPEAGTLNFTDPNNGNEISVNVVPGTIYIFYAFFDDEGNTFIKYETPYGTGIRALLLNGVNL